MTEEQENEIAENIFDWWISGKSYKRWYADKFLQLKIKFDDKRTKQHKSTLSDAYASNAHTSLPRGD